MTKKDIAKKMGHKNTKKQLRTESIPFLSKMAVKEKEGNQIEKKFGSFEERFKNFNTKK